MWKIWKAELRGRLSGDWELIFFEAKEEGRRRICMSHPLPQVPRGRIAWFKKSVGVKTGQDATEGWWGRLVEKMERRGGIRGMRSRCGSRYGMEAARQSSNEMRCSQGNGGDPCSLVE